MYSGQTLAPALPNWTLVADTADVSNTYEGCTFKESWNAWHCLNEKIGVLMFESLDADKLDRSVQPVHITNEETGFHNVLNSMMDHVWDGFYSG